MKKYLPHPTIIVVREPGGDERGQHRREKTLKEDSTLFPRREAGCFFPPEAWKENCLMMLSELPPGSRTGEGHEILSQFLQLVTRTIFSQLQGGWGDLAGRFFFLLVFFLLFSVQDSFSATFTDEVGRRVEWAAPPQRIVSVAPSVTEVLFALGLGGKVVGVSTHCNYPPEALKKEKVGGYITPSLEKIISLRPDMVIGTADGDLKSFVSRLASFGIPVYITNPRSVSGVILSVQNIGEVTFSRSAAEKVVDSMKSKMETVREKVQGRPRPRVLHVMAYDPLISSGRGTFVDDLIRIAGGINIAEGAKGKHPRYSMEEVIAQDPEVIILSSMKSKDPWAEQRQWWERWKEISAVRFGRISVIDSDLILRPSPRIVDGLEEMAKAIHPEAFKNTNFKMQNEK